MDSSEQLSNEYSLLPVLTPANQPFNKMNLCKKACQYNACIILSISLLITLFFILKIALI